jgi:carboxypeptidase Q
MSVLAPLLTVVAMSCADESMEATVRRLVQEATTRSQAHSILTDLCDGIGHRLSGSDSAARAVEWGAAICERVGADKVTKQPVMVPKWVRGEPEEFEILAPTHHRLVGLALGGSIATPPEGLTAEVMVVSSFDELTARAAAAKGKIVLFDKAMGPQPDGRTLGYGDVVAQRTQGAIEAAKVGAVGSLIRSVGTASYRLPHTGVMNYEEGVPKIPHAALASEDADLIGRLISAGHPVRIRMKMSCRDEGMAPSANVIAELKGREAPDEIVVIGGHLDSWDVGQGALDDGVGIASCIEVIRLFSDLGLRPRRTLRVVLFMNEENGLAGGKAYAEANASALARHVAAVEMDSGSFGVEGFGVTAGEGGLASLAPLAAILRETIGAGNFSNGGGGADIGPMRVGGVPMLGLKNDSPTYFRYHHTPADTVDKVAPADLAKCSAAMAAMAWWLCEAEQPLPRVPPKPEAER